MRALTAVIGRLGIVTALVVAMGVASVVATSASPDRAAASPILGNGGEYHPLTPTRILDTRPPGINDVDQPGAKPLLPGSGNRFDVNLLGQGGLPSVANAGDVLAVAVTITVVGPTAPGYMRAWGTGSAEGTSSVVNFRSGETVPNMAILVPGSNGRISVRLVSEGAAGSAHVLVDVVGWFSTSAYPSSGSRLIPVGPGRVYDSRQPQFGGTQFVGGQSVKIPIRGATSVSPSIPGIVPNQADVTGVLVNITGVNNLPGSGSTFVSVLPAPPSPGSMPATSNLNLTAGQIKANLALVPIGPDGTITLYNAAGQIHLLVDVVAYMQPRPVASREGRVIPLASPFRVIDTRLAEFGGLPLGPGRGEDWSFTKFVDDVRIGNTPVGAQSGFLANLTATDLRRPDGWFTPVDTFLTVYPRPTSATAGVPQVSNLNLLENRSVPNMALFRYGTGESRHQVRVYNYNGFVHYIVDASAVILTD